MPYDFTFPSPNWPLVPYIANLLILIPVCYSFIASGSTSSVFENAVEESDGLRLLVASLYIAILCASFGGLLAPAFFAPIVIVQVLYKTLWLVLFIMPAIMRADPIPIGISVTFALIVLIYPIFLFLAAR